MTKDLVDRMRGRVRQVRKVQQLAHDPQMIEMLQKIIDEGEADIARLEAEQEAENSTRH